MEQPLSVAEVLAEALNVWGPNGEKWIQGLWNNGRGSYCLLGGIDAARRRLGGTADSYSKAVDAVSKEINHCLGPIRFNDEYGRTFAQVKKRVCAAIKRELGVKK